MEYQEFIKGNDTKQKYDIADIFREYKHLLTGISYDQWKVVNAIINCRTEKMGYHKEVCSHCGNIEIFYNSCGNRHCPKCQTMNKARWLLKRENELLPINYFHVIFTIPSILDSIIYQNKKECYNIAFDSVRETLNEAALNPKNLGARIGFISILHTWGQVLTNHPHIHCVVTGGGLNRENKWISCKERFFISVKILSELYKNKFICKLREAYRNRRIDFYSDSTTKYYDKVKFHELVENAYNKDWIVYSKEPFANKKSVFDYIARYSHRIAISNNRIVGVDDGNVSFEYKDYRDDGKTKIMTLSVIDFMKRFLLHVLPKRFMKIRFGGIFSNRYRSKNIDRIDKELGIERIKKKIPSDIKLLVKMITGVDISICSICNIGVMSRVRSCDNKDGMDDTNFNTS